MGFQNDLVKQSESSILMKWVRHSLPSLGSLILSLCSKSVRFCTFVHADGNRKSRMSPVWEGQLFLGKINFQHFLHLLVVLSSSNLDWRDGSMVKRTYCFSGEVNLVPRTQVELLTTTYDSSARGSNTHTHTHIYTHTYDHKCTHIIHTYTLKRNKYNFSL